MKKPESKKNLWRMPKFTFWFWLVVAGVVIYFIIIGIKYLG